MQHIILIHINNQPHVTTCHTMSFGDLCARVGFDPDPEVHILAARAENSVIKVNPGDIMGIRSGMAFTIGYDEWDKLEQPVYVEPHNPKPELDRLQNLINREREAINELPEHWRDYFRMISEAERETRIAYENERIKNAALWEALETSNRIVSDIRIEMGLVHKSLSQERLRSDVADRLKALVNDLKEGLRQKEWAEDPKIDRPTT